jgi:hypothetical protein
MRLLECSIAGVVPISKDQANELLVKWDHKLGPCNRPFRTESFALEIHGEPVAVAMSCSIVHGPVAGYKTQQVVELARLCSANRTMNRVMLRIWREVLAPAYECWKPLAVVSYSHNALHAGSLYRADGWRKVKDDCGTDGKGGNWGRRGDGYKNTALHGKKSLWVYEYTTRLMPGDRFGDRS